jgi:hypothetical protein
MKMTITEILNNCPAKNMSVYWTFTGKCYFKLGGDGSLYTYNIVKNIWDSVEDKFSEHFAECNSILVI